VCCTGSDAAPALLKEHPPAAALRLWFDRLAHHGRIKHGLAGALHAATSDSLAGETHAPVIGAITLQLRACKEDGSVRPGLDPDEILLLLGFCGGSTAVLTGRCTQPGCSTSCWTACRPAPRPPGGRRSSLPAGSGKANLGETGPPLIAARPVEASKGVLVTGPAQPPVPEGELRVSDQDRDRTLELLGQHAAEGRLTLDEHEERASLVLGARTRADLAAVTRDLPALGQPSPGRAPTTAGSAPPRQATRWFVAIMGGSKRRGRFRPASVVNVLAIMGGDEIDLRDAGIDANGLTMNMYAVMGGSTIYVPNTVEVEISGFSFMGGNEDRGEAHQPRPGAPVIHIRSFNLMGGNTIWRLPPEARGLSLKEGRRLAKEAERGRLTAG